MVEETESTVLFGMQSNGPVTDEHRLWAISNLQCVLLFFRRHRGCGICVEFSHVYSLRRARLSVHDSLLPLKVFPQSSARPRQALRTLQERVSSTYHALHQGKHIPPPMSTCGRKIRGAQGDVLCQLAVS